MQTPNAPHTDGLLHVGHGTPVASLPPAGSFFGAALVGLCLVGISPVPYEFDGLDYYVNSGEHTHGDTHDFVPLSQADAGHGASGADERNVVVHDLMLSSMKNTTAAVAIITSDFPRLVSPLYQLTTTFSLSIVVNMFLHCFLDMVLCPYPWDYEPEGHADPKQPKYPVNSVDHIIKGGVLFVGVKRYELTHVTLRQGLDLLLDLVDLALGFYYLPQSGASASPDGTAHRPRYGAYSAPHDGQARGGYGLPASREEQEGI